jgi:lipopolysaccharide export system permease protein
MFPLSVYLTTRATNDKGVFNLDAIIVPFKRLFTPRTKLNLSESETKEFNYYKKYSVEQLVAIVKKQEDFDLNKKPKEIALHNLLHRNIGLENLKKEGLDIPNMLFKAKALLKDYNDYSKTSLVSYTIGGILLILHFVFKNNKLPEVAEASLSLSIMAFVFFVIYALVDAVVYSRFYKTIDLPKKKLKPLILLLTLPVYPLKFIVLRNKIDQDFYYSCLQNIK